MNKKLLFDQPRWMFISVFGKKYVEENGDKSLEEFMDGHPQKFKSGRKKDTHLILPKKDKFHYEYFTETGGWIFEDISNLEAFNDYGISVMEEVIEKSYTIIGGDIIKSYNKRINREKRLGDILNKDQGLS